MNRKLLARAYLILGILSLMFLVGCGGGTASTVNNPLPLPSEVTVSPTSATVQAGRARQFTATVSPGGVNQAVTWSVSGPGCSGASCGAIDVTGDIYRASGLTQSRFRNDHGDLSGGLS